MKVWTFPVILFLGYLMLVSCDSAVSAPIKHEPIAEHPAEEVSFFKFTPDSSDFTFNEQMLADYAYQLDSLTIVAGYNQFGDNEAFAIGDTEDDWGDRLYVLNSKGETIYQSQGVGDYYLFEPHFYKNNANDEIIIVCQLGFEYFDGGEVFLLKNGKVNYLGNIDVSGPDMDTNLIDILSINAEEDEFVFSFEMDSVLYSPGNGDPKFVSSSELNYRYKDGVFSEIWSH